MSGEITLRYRRPPDRVQVFRQRLVAREAECVVTLLDAAELTAPLKVEDETILEPGAPVVWFTFPGAWHDIGRFHRADGTFTGLYANILTPVVGMEGMAWETTDLFLDVWLPADGATPRILDAEELTEAEAVGHIAPELGRRARAEAAALLEALALGAWPPASVPRWTLPAAAHRLQRR